MKFARFWNPGAALSTAAGEFRSLGGADLTIEWSARRDDTMAPDTATVRIFNPLPARARAVEELWRAQIKGPISAVAELSLGWDRVLHRLMLGDITRVNYGPEGADRVLEVEIGDGQDAYGSASVGPMISGSTIAQALRMLITLPRQITSVGVGGLGYTLPAESEAVILAAAGSSVPYRGLPVGESTASIVRVLLESLGLSGRVQNGVFWAMRGRSINRPGPIFRPSSGRLAFRGREDGGAQIEALADPTVEPGMQAQVQNDQGKPEGAAVYRVEQCNWAGSTRGQSVMMLELAPGVLL